MEFDNKLNLFRGAAVYGDGISAYPDHYKEANPIYSDIVNWSVRNPEKASKNCYSGHLMCCLSTNCVFYEVYNIIVKIAAELNIYESYDIYVEKAKKLKKSINKNFWNEDLGTYVYLIDEIGICNHQEGLGLAFVILFNIADKEKIEKIFKNIKLTNYGIACVYPSFKRYKLDENSFGRHSGTVWPFIQMFFAEAAVKAGYIEEYENEIKCLTELVLKYDGFYELYHPLTGEPYGGIQEAIDWRIWESVPRQTWSATGYFKSILVGIFGISFDVDKILFSSNNTNLLNYANLNGIKISDFIINLSYKKTGEQSITINGKSMDYISRNSKGEFNVVITV